MKQGQVVLKKRRKHMCLKNVLSSPWVSDEYIVLHTPFLRPSSRENKNKANAPSIFASHHKQLTTFGGAMIKVHRHHDPFVRQILNLFVILLFFRLSSILKVLHSLG